MMRLVEERCVISFPIDQAYNFYLVKDKAGEQILHWWEKNET